MGKTITGADVKRVAEAQIEEKSSTTTLYVKMQLRKEGYFAKQSDVSREMNQLKESGVFDSIDNDSGSFQIYSFPKKDSKFGKLKEKITSGFKKLGALIKSKYDSIPRFALVRK